MATITRKILDSWQPICCAATVCLAIGGSRAQVSVLEDRVKDIQAVKPDVLQEQIARNTADIAEIRGDLMSIRIDGQASRADLAYIRGKLDRDVPSK